MAPDFCHELVHLPDGGRGSLMPDVFCCCCVNGVLGNVGSMIADAFEAAANKNQIQVAPQLIRVLCHSIDQFVTGHSVQLIQFLISRNDRACKIDVLACERIYAVLEHRHGMVIHRPDQLDFVQWWVLI